MLSRLRSRARSRGTWILAGILAACAACGTTAPEREIRLIDLARQLDAAEKRPHGGSFHLAHHTLGSAPRLAVVVPVPSRVIWTTRVPRRAVLRVSVGMPASTPAAAVRFRIGVSDHRIYESLAEQTVTAGDLHDVWRPLEVDLSMYAGPKPSLFYQPDGREWRIVLSTDAIDGTERVAFWAEPGIHTDVAAARRFLKTNGAP